jgi:glycerate kinase
VTHVLLAPDKFKGTLTAGEVADHLGAGRAAARPDLRDPGGPGPDGGDGLLDAAVHAGFEPVHVEARDASGTVHRTRYVRRGREAVVELAEVCGLSRYAGRALDPLGASSRGVGEVVARALADGCTRIVLGVGGSASTDGGAGLLSALGARPLDASGEPVADGGGALLDVVRLELGGLDPALADAEVVVACDVTNPLTGPTGAAAVYGPQKGADEDQVRLLDGALTHWADLAATATGADLRDTPGAGAAGGVGFGALVIGAKVRAGAEVVFELTRFEDALDGAAVVVTGEGSLDEQTLHGKAPARVAELARSHGIPVVAVAGRCALDEGRLREAGFTASYSLTDEADADEAMTRPGPLLERIGARIAAGLTAVVEES